MTLQAVGTLLAERRREKGFTLRQLADAAKVGRSTLAALEAGNLPELGYEKVRRICSVLDLVLEPRPLALQEPLMDHRHLTESAGRDLTKAAIEDIILRGNLSAWRGLVRAIRSDPAHRIANRVRDLLYAADRSDPKIQAFSRLLPELLRNHENGTG